MKGAVDRNDVLFTLGLALMAVGLWLIYQPLAPIAIGLVLMAIATLAARHGNKAGS